ncbi:terminase small subunit [Ottowia sp. VDI28]|uniref:terminase small subunit n=1 Tax=Ottowia sp. VDI28 TaxID=3133968 RepID=UPI003C2AAD8B
MAQKPAGKKPAPRKTPNSKPAAPKKRAAGKAVPAKAKPPAKKVTKATIKAPTKRKAAATKATPLPKDKPQLGLTDKQQRFIEEYLVDLNASQAAIRAGYSPDTAGSIGHENLKKPDIQLALLNARKAQQERTNITADGALREAWNVATADARELVELRVGCCRCCYGEGHKYQRTIGELNRDREAWVEKGKNPAEFDEAGGIGFNPLLLPHPSCPICGGDGQSRVVLKDTRSMSEKAVALYAGAKQTQHGIEIKLNSKLDALEKVFKHLGLYEKDNQQKTDPLAALLHSLANGNGNGFKPVAVDPEGPAASQAANSLQPRQDVADEDSGNGNED